MEGEAAAAAAAAVCSKFEQICQFRTLHIYILLFHFTIRLRILYAKTDGRAQYIYRIYKSCLHSILWANQINNQKNAKH